jgi:TolA-binding protein
MEVARMIRSIALSLVFLGALARTAGAQDDTEKLKKDILDKVRAKLADERAKILKRIGEILDEELGKKKQPDATADAETEKRLKDLEKKMRILEEQREELAIEIAKTKRMGEDADLRRDAKKSGPQDTDEASSLFDEALKDHEGKDFKSSIRKFKMIYYNFPREGVGIIAAYNVACGYALLGGHSQHALDWLEISVRSGYQDFEHIRKDADLDSLRNEKRYKKLLADK